MKHKYKKSNIIIVFSQWSRKNYAIFASLHKVVNIASVSIDTCISSFTKNKFVIHLLNTDIKLDISENEFGEQNTIFSNWFIELLIELGLIKLDKSFKKTNFILEQNKGHILLNAEYGLFIYN